MGSLILDPKGPIAPGFDRGFEVYDAGFRHRRAGEDPYRTKERRGSEVVARALAWLEHRPPGPLFLWVHLYDAHDPYDPPPAFAARFAGAPYDGEVAAVDAAVGDLLAGLSGRGIFDGALLVVASDHGEGLGDHGESTHGVFLYDEHLSVCTRYGERDSAVVYPSNGARSFFHTTRASRRNRGSTSPNGHFQ